MKKFLTNLSDLFPFIALVIILNLGGVAYRNTSHYINLERAEETEKFHHVPENIDIAVLGSSNGRDAFQVFPEGWTSFNFCMSSQTPAYDEKMMLQFGNRFHEDTLVILTVSYVSPFWNESEEDFTKKQGRYYRILCARNIINVDMEDYYLQKFSPLLVEDSSTVISAFATPEELNDYYSGDLVFQSDQIDTEQERILRDHYGNATSAHFPEGNPLMMDAYRRMLTMCQNKNWNVILVIPPYTSVYNECFPREYIEAFYANLGGLVEEFQIPYFDYSNNDQFLNHFELFKNIDHLNDKGAAVFDEIFFEDIRERGLL